MCEKRPNEPWLAYMCRYVVEQPRAVLAVIGIAAAIVLYCDLRSFIAEQAEAQEKTIRVLSEMSVRLQTIEHRMEVLHIQQSGAEANSTCEMMAKGHKTPASERGSRSSFLPRLAGGFLCVLLTIPSYPLQ